MTVRILDDAIIDYTLEYFRVHLFSSEYRISQTPYATVYIQDNDGMQNLYCCGISSLHDLDKYKMAVLTQFADSSCDHVFS